MNLRLPPRPPKQCDRYEFPATLRLFDSRSQIRDSRMPNDRKIDVSFSASAEDVIRRFMKVAEETMPNANLVPMFMWHISRKFTNKVTGEVRTFGPGVDVGAIDPNDLADELIVPLGELNVAIRLPEELQSADRLKFDYLNGSFVVTTN
jgi:hypothetical protein